MRTQILLSTKQDRESLKRNNRMLRTSSKTWWPSLLINSAINRQSAPRQMSEVDLMPSLNHYKIPWSQICKKEKFRRKLSFRWTSSVKCSKITQTQSLNWKRTLSVMTTKERYRIKKSAYRRNLTWPPLWRRLLFSSQLWINSVSKMKGIRTSLCTASPLRKVVSSHSWSRLQSPRKTWTKPSRSTCIVSYRYSLTSKPRSMPTDCWKTINVKTHSTMLTLVSKPT